MMNDDTGSDAIVQRDSAGRWRKGFSGNVAGRPAGSHGRLTVQLRECAEKLLPLMMEQAENGSLDAMKFLIGLGAPKLKAVSVREELPTTPDEILAGMTAGGIDVDVARGALDCFLVAGKIRELETLSERVAELEKRLAVNGR